MATKKKRVRRPKLRVPKRTPVPLDEGPLEWLSPMLEETYMKLRPKEQAEAEAQSGAKAKPSKPKLAAKGTPKKVVFKSVHQVGMGESVLASLPRTHWESLLREFRERKAAVGLTADALL